MPPVREKGKRKYLFTIYIMNYNAQIVKSCRTYIFKNL